MRNGKPVTMDGVGSSARTATGSWRNFGILCLQLCFLGAATAMVAPAQTQQASTGAVKFTTLVNFDGTDGYEPYAAPVQGADGNLYGGHSPRGNRQQ